MDDNRLQPDLLMDDMRMRLLVLPLFIILLLLAGGQPATASTHEVDFVVTFQEDGTWTYDGPNGMLTPRRETPGESYRWDLTIAEPMAIGEIRYPLTAFDIERNKQLQPRLDQGEERFPLFHYFPRAEVWETDGPAQVYHVSTDGATQILRLQIPQTVSGVLHLERDVAPPEHTLGPVEEVARHSFYQETHTEELAIADLQVRRAGTDGEWVRNPTPDYHVLQKFPIQGLDPDTSYDVRVVFTDWSDNTVTTDTYTVTTLPETSGAPPSFEVLSPEPDAVLASGAEATVRVRLLAGDTAVDPATVRLFVDLSEVNAGFQVADDLLVYDIPGPLADGTHVVSVEARTLDGAQDHVRWSFIVGTPTVEAAPGPAGLVLPLLLLLFALRRRPVS